MQDAPFHDGIARGPDGMADAKGRAVWLRTADGLRLRAALWPAGPRGTVFLFNGRTEYAEKYGPAAACMARRGYGMVTLDWRGQGLSDRPHPDPSMGHVRRFSDYQIDAAALVSAARAMDLPRPWHLMAHSMGATVALRTLLGGHPFASVALSAPMWGILFPPRLFPVAVGLSFMAGITRQAHRRTPGTAGDAYPAHAAFDGNLLTTDPAMYGWMARQIREVPALSIGGPSLAWLAAAMRECAALSHLPSPKVPCVCALGSHERIVATAPIHRRMAAWPGGRLDLYDGAEHEVMMEAPHHRTRFYDAAAALFDAADGSGAATG